MSRSRPGTGPATRSRAFVEVSLDALTRNWRALTAMSAPATVAPVVKADGYGLGAIPIAEHLWRLGARNFWAFDYPGASALRRSLPDACILMLGGLPHGAGEDCVHERLLPAIGALDELEEWRKAAAKAARPLPLALHFDTCLNRYAVPEPELRRIAAEPDRWLKGLKPALWMSHLADSETPDSPRNKHQLRLFHELSALLPPAPRSLAATCGVGLGKEWHLDMVRPGAGIYGMPVIPGLHPIARIAAQVVQLKEIAPGERLGYGGQWQAPSPSRIATIAIGYADGLNRESTPPGTPLWFKREPLPLRGRISMDLASVEVPQNSGLQTGDWVDLLPPPDPPKTPVPPLAYRRALTVSLGYRVERRYRQAGRNPPQ